MKSNPATDSNDRRMAPRYCFYAALEIDWGSKALWGRVRDISRDGMFIEIAEWPWVNAHFSARLSLDTPLEMECVVRRIVAGQGIGVTVAFQSTEGEKRFDALLRALRHDVGPPAASQLQIAAPVPVSTPPAAAHPAMQVVASGQTESLADA